MDNMPMLKQDDLSDLKAVSKKLREYERSNSVAALHYMGQSLIEELEAAREKIATIEIERDCWKTNHEQRERESHEDATTVRTLADRTQKLESEADTLRRVGEEMQAALAAKDEDKNQWQTLAQCLTSRIEYLAEIVGCPQHRLEAEIAQLRQQVEAEVWECHEIKRLLSACSVISGLIDSATSGDLRVHDARQSNLRAFNKELRRAAAECISHIPAKEVATSE